MVFAGRLRASEFRAAVRTRRSGGRATRLMGEQLESRLALTTVAASVDSDVGESLGAYLAQAVEMGPVAPPAAAPVAASESVDASTALEPAMVDASLAAIRYETAPEGDAMFNRSPLVIHFNFQRTSLGLRLFGSVVDDDPATCYVQVDGMISVSDVPVNADGTFSVIVPDPGGFGYVTAVAYDYYGMNSVTAGVFIF